MPAHSRLSALLLSLICAVVALAAPSVSSGTLAAETSPKPNRFAPVSELTGRCWSGTLPEGDTRDVHCFEWVLDDRFVRDRHRVIGPEGVYQGETFYGWDERAERLRFWYFNSLGGVSEGTVERQDDRWIFHGGYSGPGGEIEMRTVLAQEGTDAYTLRTETRDEQGWKASEPTRYRALGTRPAETGGPWAEGVELAFNSSREGDYEIYLLDPDSGDDRRLTEAPTTEWVYTVAGDRLVVVSDRPAGAEKGYRLYRLDPVTGELDRLTDFPVADSWVGVLPGGRGFVVCTPADGDKELFLLDPRGEIVRRLTDNDADDCQPDVTPDGETVVFWSMRGGSGELWAMGIDGSHPRQLTHFAGNDRVPRHRYGGEGPPRISPDGTRVAWMSIRDGDDWDIYSMALDGSDVRRLTDHLADDGYPAWSPDGRFLAFDSNRAGTFDLWVIPATGDDVHRLTDHPGNEQAPVWVRRRPPAE